MTAHELWRHFKERHDNPLCIYFNPVRKLKVRLAYYAVLLFQSLLLLSHLDRSPEMFYYVILGRYPKKVEGIHSGLLYGTPLLLHVTLLVAWIWVREHGVRADRLKDLQASGLTVERARFGALYSVVSLGAALVLILSVIGAFLISPLLLRYVPFRYGHEWPEFVRGLLEIVRVVVLHSLLFCIIWTRAILWDPAARVRSVAVAVVLSASGALAIEMFGQWMRNTALYYLSALRVFDIAFLRISVIGECCAIIMALWMLKSALAALSHAKPRGLVGDLDDLDRPLLAWHERESVFRNRRTKPREAARDSSVGALALHVVPLCFSVLALVFSAVILQSLYYVYYSELAHRLPAMRMPRPFSWQDFSVLKVVTDHRLLELMQSLTHIAALSLLPILYGVFLGLRKDVQARVRELADEGKLLRVTSRAALFPCLAMAAIPLGLGSILLSQSIITPARFASIPTGWFPFIGAAQFLLMSFPVAVAALISVASARTPAFACMMWLIACFALHMSWLVFNRVDEPFTWLFGNVYCYDSLSLRHGSLFLALFSVFWVIPHSMRALDKEQWARAEGGAAP